jgi:maltose O-acetyltransferase
LDPVDRRAGWETTAPITIRDGAWLGAGVIVCPGVTIGENTVVGAGSVVTRDLPDRVVAVGNPCRVRRGIP